METTDRDRRSTVWLAMISVLLVLAIAQLDEHRRFRRVQDAYIRALALRAAQSTAYVDQLNQFLATPAEERANLPMPPPHFPEKAPPEPRAADYMLVARVRQALCLGAFAVAAALPVVWAMAAPDFRRRNRRLIAEAMLALALFGTIGMMLGWGHLGNWKNFSIGTNAAGYGLVLVPLGVIAVLLASRDGDVGDVESAAGSDGDAEVAGDGAEAAGGSKT
jgi:hypothetical protein